MWATLKDRNGFAKDRPGIILNPTREIRPGVALVVMAITTSYPDPPPEHHMPLPWNPDPRRVRTGLAQRSAAVLTWLNAIEAGDVIEVKGDVPPPLMRRIDGELQKLREAADGPGPSSEQPGP